MLFLFSSALFHAHPAAIACAPFAPEAFIDADRVALAGFGAYFGIGDELHPSRISGSFARLPVVAVASGVSARVAKHVSCGLGVGLRRPVASAERFCTGCVRRFHRGVRLHTCLPHLFSVVVFSGPFV